MTLDRDRLVRALPSYEIGDEIGRGAWGVVVVATHRQLGRSVAVKELPAAFASDPGVRRRFTSEARLLAGLDHPHIVPIYDYVEDEGLCLLVMELLSGGTLWSRFSTEGVTAAAACGIVIAACSALQHAHERGILHRDIKPDNLLFSGTHTLKVSDFGIAKVVGGVESMGTRTGDVLGTPAYMAPEQALGTELSPATDVYALGTVLYELLSGRLPFSDEGNAIALLYRHVHEEPIPLAELRPDLAPELVEVTMRALARDPADRYPSAEDFGVALAQAANAAWGHGWVRAGGVNVVASGRIGDYLTGPGPDASPPDAMATDGGGAAPVTEVAPAVAPGSGPDRRTRSTRASVTVADPPHPVDPLADAPPSPDELVPLSQVVATGPPAPDTLAVSDAPHPILAAPTTAPGAEESAPPAPPSVVPTGSAPVPSGERPSKSGRRWLLIGAAVVVVASVVGVVVVVVGGGGSGHHLSGPPKVTATIPVGTGADHVATGLGAVWVTDGRHSLIRIDPKANTISSTEDLGVETHAVIVAGAELWVSSSGAEVLRVRPGSAGGASQVTHIAVGGAVSELAEGDGSVWGSSPYLSALLRIDERTDKVVATIKVGTEPDSVAFGAGSAWVANRSQVGTVLRVDPTTNRVVATITVGGLPDEIAFADGSLWAANAGSATVSKIDPATNHVVATLHIGSRPAWVVGGEGAVWVTDARTRTLYRIDPGTDEVTGTVPVGIGAESTEAGYGSLWVVDAQAASVSRVAPG